MKVLALTSFVAIALAIVSDQTQAESTSFEDPQPPALEVVQSDSDDQLCELCCGPCWTFEAGVLVLHRSNPDNVILMTNPAAAGATVLESDDAELDWAVGSRFSLFRDNGPCCAGWELTYFVIDDWNAAAAIADTGVDYETPFTGGQIFRSGRFEHESTLHSVESNWRCDSCCGWTLLHGFRYFNLSEAAMFQVDGPGGPGQINIDVENHLFGWQLGAEKTVCCHDCWTFDMWSKAGVYYNDFEQTRVTSGNFGPAAQRQGDDEIAFVGELAIRGEYCLSCCCSLYAGYQLLWLGVDGEGIVTAPGQIDDFPTPPMTTQTGGDVLYHGAMFGLQIVH